MSYDGELCEGGSSSVTLTPALPSTQPHPGPQHRHRLLAVTALSCRLHPHIPPTQMTLPLVQIITFPNRKANSVCSCFHFSPAQTLMSVRFPTRAPEERVQTQKVPSHASPVGQDLESQRMDINVKVRLSCVHCSLRICVLLSQCVYGGVGDAV